MRRLLTRLAAAVLAVALLAGPAAPAEGEGAWYDVTELNVGLGPVPAAIDRETPRSTLESLFRAARRDDWRSAAHVLNLNDIPPERQAEDGPALARKLKTVIERKVVLDWSQLVDRPDGFHANETADAATAGMKRRSLLLWELSLGSGPPASIRLQRVKPGAGDAVWVFAPQSVEEIDALYREYGPSAFEEYLPDWSKREALFDLMRWELLGLPVLIAVALLAGFAVRRVIHWIRRRIDNRVTRAVVKAAALPLMIFTVTTVIHVAMTTIFVFSGRIDVFLTPLVAVGYVTATLMLVVNTIEAALDRIMGRNGEIDLTSSELQEQRDIATRLTAARRLIVIVVFLVGSALVLASADVFQTLGFSLLASAGALTIVLGFAARKVLGNIMSSMQIALNRSARVGDRVVYRDHLCYVEWINFTFVQLRDWTGTRLIVPVEEFVSETFENWMIADPEMIRVLEFKLEPSVDLDALREVFAEVIDSLDPKDVSDPEQSKITVTGQDVFGIDVWCYVPCSDPNTSWDTACEAREKLVGRIREMEERSGTRIFPEVKPAEAA